MNSFCYATRFDEMSNKKLRICKHEAIRSFMMAELWKSAKRNTYTQNSKIKTDQQQVERKKLWKCIIFCNDLLDQRKKRLRKYFL